MTKASFRSKFHGLLWIEEIEMITEQRKLDQYGVKFESDGCYHYFRLAGLRENYKLSTGEALTLKQSDTFTGSKPVLGNFLLILCVQRGRVNR